MSTCLATGGTGFIALYIVKLLLEQGHTVHTTVRSLKNTTKCKPLLDLQSQHPGRLSLFEADLMKDGSFQQAIDGCTVVYHVASPFMIPAQIKDGLKECVEPALQGTKNVLESVNQCQSVRRVVLTSSIAAMYSDAIEITRSPTPILTETAWNSTSSATNNPYHYSKTLVVINPGLVLGPSLTPESISGSLFMVDNMFRGDNRMGVPELYYPLVDVRDVAEAHVSAATSESAKGRYIMADVVRSVHRSPKVLPRRNLPRVLVYAAGPFIGVSIWGFAGNLGVRFEVDNGKSVRELGMVYRSVEGVLRDHYEAWVGSREER
ncbi:NAD(P)-binding protein [Aspergillus ellipticus CBS 707.79]|uniref:NAD(P)-binding protein n=1 Tax=Aspergillus ellipticus CBS 707.79 TaxID=1448320 RepID=A0A319D819_9EURO|nr:NAD(P)-binding protein [Aspergillus ellipticus CBS 707.79]